VGGFGLDSSSPDRDWWRAFVNMVPNEPLSFMKGSKFLKRKRTVRFSRGTLVHVVS
jgi:hypothetical protein